MMTILIMILILTSFMFSSISFSRSSCTPDSFAVATKQWSGFKPWSWQRLEFPALLSKSFGLDLVYCCCLVESLNMCYRRQRFKPVCFLYLKDQGLNQKWQFPTRNIYQNQDFQENRCPTGINTHMPIYPDYLHMLHIKMLHIRLSVTGFRWKGVNSQLPESNFIKKFCVSK